ncbi:hypothetical protein HDZ31DRAFT_70224 [Schizophyllum fasciatum]
MIDTRKVPTTPPPPPRSRRARTNATKVARGGGKRERAPVWQGERGDNNVALPCSPHASARGPPATHNAS